MSIDLGEVSKKMESVGVDGAGKTWWADRNLWEGQVKKAEESGGDLKQLALGYCQAFLDKNSETIGARFGNKYGTEFNPDNIGGYQPNSAWGGGYVDVDILRKLKGIEGQEDLLPLSEAVNSEYGLSNEIIEAIEAKDIEGCREVLKKINPEYNIEVTEENIDGDENIKGWGGLDTIVVKGGKPFEEIHPTLVHEISHKYFDELKRRMQIPFPSELRGNDFDKYIQVGKDLILISDEEVARLNEIRVCLNRFEETKKGVFLEELIDSAKFYNWHCFGRI